MGLDNPLHIAVILLLVLLVFGARRLPEIGRSLGTGMREFKESVMGESKPTGTLPAGEQTPAQAPAQPPPAAPQPPAPPVATPGGGASSAPGASSEDRS